MSMIFFSQSIPSSDRIKCKEVEMCFFFVYFKGHSSELKITGLNWIWSGFVLFDFIFSVYATPAPPKTWNGVIF